MANISVHKAADWGADKLSEGDRLLKVGIWGAVLVGRYVWRPLTGQMVPPTYWKVVQYGLNTRLAWVSLFTITDGAKLINGTWMKKAVGEEGNETFEYVSNRQKFCDVFMTLTDITTSLCGLDALTPLNFHGWGSAIGNLCSFAWVTGSTINLACGDDDESKTEHYTKVTDLYFALFCTFFSEVGTPVAFSAVISGGLGLLPIGAAMWTQLRGNDDE